MGALLFVGMGATYAIMAWPYPAWIVLFAAPLFLVGGLFLRNWRYRTELHAPTHPR